MCILQILSLPYRARKKKKTATLLLYPYLEIFLAWTENERAGTVPMVVSSRLFSSYTCAPIQKCHSWNFISGSRQFVYWKYKRYRATTTGEPERPVRNNGMIFTEKYVVNSGTQWKITSSRLLYQRFLSINVSKELLVKENYKPNLKMFSSEVTVCTIVHT